MISPAFGLKLGKFDQGSFIATTSVQVELYGIAIPDLIVRADVGRVLVEAPQADVQVMVVPKEEKLPTSVGEIGMADMDRRDERPVPLVKVAVHLNWLLSPRDQTDDRLLLPISGAGRKSPQHKKENCRFPGTVHFGSSLLQRAVLSDHASLLQGGDKG